MGFGELELCLPSRKDGRRGTRCLPSPKDGRGAGGEGKDLKQDSDAPVTSNYGNGTGQ
jgi:hypothetical protein